MSSKFRFEDEEVAGSGTNFIGIAGEDLTNRQLVRIGAAGTLVSADASAAATLPAIGIALAAASEGQHVLILLKGWVGLSTWTWTPGTRLYTSDVAGALIQATGTITQEVGVASSATQIWFDPQGLDTGGAVGAHILATTGPHTNTLPLIDLEVGVQGEVIIRGAVDWEALGVGAAGLVLTAGGAGVSAAWAAGGGDPTDQFFAAPDPDGYIGPYASMTMLDGADTIVRQTFRLPNNWTASWGVSLVVIPAATGNLRRTITTNFCAAGEVYNTHADAIAAGIQAVTLNEQELIDITAALTGAAAGDLVGIEYLRDASTSVADTVAATVHYIGVLLTEA